MKPSTMNANSKSLAILLLGAGLCLVVLTIVQAAPAYDPEESSDQLSHGPSEESAIGGDSDFDEPSSRAAAQAAAQEDEDLAPASNPLSMADSQDEPSGSDSNIANAKVQMNPTDMATAAGHHYHGHDVSGKMEMGAHTEKKGAFGWHAKFPVGGKGKK